MQASAASHSASSGVLWGGVEDGYVRGVGVGRGSDRCSCQVSVWRPGYRLKFLHIQPPLQVGGVVMEERG